MRWKLKHTGDKKIRRGFLFLPRGSDTDRRWLERASWIEEYQGWEPIGCQWHFVKWLPSTDDESLSHMMEVLK